jgi:hypothetical protein
MRSDEVPLGEVVDRLPVPFAGEGEGEAGLTFGQLGLWQTMANNVSRTIAHVAEADPGTTVADVADMLGFMVGRHESLRTTLVLREDGGLPRQRVTSAGETPLVVVSPGTADPAEVAEALSMHWQVALYDLENELPVRMAAIVAGGEVTHVVTVILHTSIDAFGLLALVADIGARDRATGAAAGPVTALTPLAQAAREASPAGRRQNERSLRYLEQVLRVAPTTLFGPPRYDVARHIEVLRYRSHALGMAIRAVAARESMGDSPAMLAAFVAAVARVTGRTGVPVLVMVSNRFRPGYADSVSSLIKISPFLLDVADLTLGEAVVRTGGQSLSVYKNAYYDAYDQDEVVARVEEERGERFDLSCYYNDHRLGDRARAGDAAPSEADIRAALADSELTWLSNVGVPGAKLTLSVDDLDGPVDLTLSGDLRYFSRDDLAGLARTIEEVAVQTAIEPGTPAAHARPVPAGVAR